MAVTAKPMFTEMESEIKALQQREGEEEEEEEEEVPIRLLDLVHGSKSLSEVAIAIQQLARWGVGAVAGRWQVRWQGGAFEILFGSMLAGPFSGYGLFFS